MLLEASARLQSGSILHISRTAYSAGHLILECAKLRNTLEHTAVALGDHFLLALSLLRLGLLKTVSAEVIHLGVARLLIQSPRGHLKGVLLGVIVLVIK
jgi:hypothetical protein